jgi:hypothetical protein
MGALVDFILRELADPEKGKGEPAKAAKPAKVSNFSDFSSHPVPDFERPEARQDRADRRNRAAISAGHTDRFCACGTMATVAVFDPSPTRSNHRWVCSECFRDGVASGAIERPAKRRPSS